MELIFYTIGMLANHIPPLNIYALAPEEVKAECERENIVQKNEVSERQREKQQLDSNQYVTKHNTIIWKCQILELYPQRF